MNATLGKALCNIALAIDAVQKQVATVDMNVETILDVLAHENGSNGEAFDRINVKLDAILRREGRLERQEEKDTMSILDAIQADATELTSLKDSLNASYAAIAAEIADLTAKLENAQVPPELVAQAQAIHDTLTGDNTAIHDAIVANTPAAPEPPPADQPTA